uniref:Uncharacterized protein n=1 Tax=Rhodosorus marinus TaxID=101924 RepID=A0A7S0G686_9RHOD|mmetsp:Transcript_25186/g.36286  ORF Transcript_25186/g.36286 Transcript_25186/m.36286 type:complete len:148 (+) Transcript_25186:107-550(+)
MSTQNGGLVEHAPSRFAIVVSKDELEKIQEENRTVHDVRRPSPDQHVKGSVRRIGGEKGQPGYVPGPLVLSEVDFTFPLEENSGSFHSEERVTVVEVGLETNSQTTTSSSISSSGVKSHLSRLTRAWLPAERRKTSAKVAEQRATVE